MGIPSIASSPCEGGFYPLPVCLSCISHLIGCFFLEVFSLSSVLGLGDNWERKRKGKREPRWEVEGVLRSMLCGKKKCLSGGFLGKDTEPWKVTGILTSSS